MWKRNKKKVEEEEEERAMLGVLLSRSCSMFLIEVYDFLYHWAIKYTKQASKQLDQWSHVSTLRGEKAIVQSHTNRKRFSFVV